MADVHPSLLLRKIIHIDMDAFYAAVEMRDNPALRGKALIVGGSPTGRGVVATASYEARKFGIRSAMPCYQAIRLCPQAVFVKPRFEAYKEASFKIREIFHRYTDLVEPLSLDEAYLDVTGNQLGIYASEIAKRIRREVFNELQLTCSAGVAPNKLVAKIASDACKPNGCKVVTPAQVFAFMQDLSLRHINGVGPATEKRLATRGLERCRDVTALSLEQMDAAFGRLGRWLWWRAQGIDERGVETTRERKSIGSERTFGQDTLDQNILCTHIDELAARVGAYMQKRSLTARTITLKVRYHDFKRITRSQTLDTATADAAVVAQIARSLLLRTDAGKRRIRLVGVALSALAPGE